MVSTKVCRSSLGMFFTLYWQKPFQPVFLLTCKKQKLTQGKILQQGLLVLILLCPSRQVFVNIYSNDMQINKWLRLSISLWGIPLRCDLFGRIDQTNFLLFSIPMKGLKHSKVRREKQLAQISRKYVTESIQKRTRIKIMLSASPSSVFSHKVHNIRFEKQIRILS